MGVRANMRELWRRVSSIHAGDGQTAVLPRQTQVLPLVLNPYHAGQIHLPKPTPENLRRFAETPVVRRILSWRRISTSSTMPSMPLSSP